MTIPSLEDLDAGTAAVLVSCVAIVLSFLSVLVGIRRGPDHKHPSMRGVTAAIVLLIIVLVTFVVAQPLIWRAAFDEPPPTTATDLGSVMGLLLTIASLVGAGVGALLYRVIEFEMRDRTEKTKAQVNDALKLTGAAQMANSGYLSWLAYEQIWREAGYSERASGRPGFRAFLESALLTTENAVAEYARCSPEVRRGQDAIAKRNLAYHLATRCRPEDGPRAIKLLSETGDVDNATDPDVIETCAWVYQRLSRDEHKKELLLEKLRLAMEGDVSDDWRTAVRERYLAVFRIDLNDRQGNSPTGSG